jgi:AraC-like DNA-binding protein
VTRWLGRPPKLTREQYRELMRVRQARRELPTYAALARRFGVPERYVLRVLRRPIARYER